MKVSFVTRSRRAVRSWSTTRTAVGAILIVCALVGGGGVYAALVLGGEQNSVDLRSGLVGWWKMDGNANDSSGKGGNGTVVGAALTTDRKGTANAAYAFTGGTNSYINAGTGTTGSPLSFSGDFSLSAWVNPTSYHTTGYFNLKNGFMARGTASTYNYAMQASDATSIAFIKRTGAEGLQFYTFTGIPSLTNQWTLVTATIQGSTLSLYINGSLYGTKTVGAIAPGTSDPMYIGTDVPGNTETSFAGSLDDVRIYNRAVNAAEAKALYTEHASLINVANGEKGLVGWWKFDGNLKDSTPYAQTATATGGGGYTADRKGAPNSGYTLDGTSQFVSMGTPRITTTFTYSGWFKINAFTSTWGAAFGDFRHAANPPNGVNFIPRAGSIAICVGDNTGTYSGTNCNITFSASAVQAGSWIHGAVTYDGTTLTAYINGQSIGSTVRTITHVNTTFTAGKWASSYTDYFMNGSVDDIRVYSRALSGQEIASQYNSYNSQINLNAAPTSQPTENINAGLIGYWPFNGNAKDSTPYQNNGSVTGASITADRRGRPGSAYSFNGSAYIASNTSPTLTISGTLSSWVYINSWTTNYDAIIFRGPGVGWSSIDYTIVRNGGVNQFVGSISDGTNTLASAGPKSSTISPGQWYMLTFTWDGADAKFYTDGSLTGTVAWTHAAANRSGKIDFGSAQDNTSYHLNGVLDDARLYNRALSAMEVQALYNNYE